MWKIVGGSEASVLYIYIYIQINNAWMKEKDIGEKN